MSSNMPEFDQNDLPDYLKVCRECKCNIVYPDCYVDNGGMLCNPCGEKIRDEKVKKYHEDYEKWRENEA